VFWQKLWNRHNQVRPPRGRAAAEMKHLQDPDQPIPADTNGVRKWLSSEWQPSDDLHQRALSVGGRTVLLLWLRGMTDLARVEEGIVTPLLDTSAKRPDTQQLKSLLHTVMVREIRTRQAANLALCEGQVLLCLDGSSIALALEVSNPPQRAIETADNEPTLQGPQEAFVEQLDLNISLIRKRIRSPRLKVEATRIGLYSQTKVCLVYIEDIVKPALIEEARSRLRGIAIDGVNDQNKLRELIEDAPQTPFPTTEETERPDRVAGSLLQGRLAIMIDGAPTCMLVPTQFINFLASAEDYYTHHTLTLFIRLLRHTAFWSALLLPSLYVALLSYNQDLVPTQLLVTVAAQHRGIPFPTVVEALLMMASFEALREAGTRLPKAVGQSVSIVGTLIIGDAAVRAGIVSPGMVIIVAGTGVASFAMPAYGFVNTTRVLQFLFVIAASIFGLVGIVLTGLVLVTHLVSLRSFGVPYMGPIAPFNLSDMHDMFIRAPWYAMTRRPQQLETLDPVSNRSRSPRSRW
jgi:hypothetical protein